MQKPASLQVGSRLGWPRPSKCPGAGGHQSWAEPCSLRAAGSWAVRSWEYELRCSYLGAPRTGRLPAAARGLLVRLSSNRTPLKEWTYFPCHLLLHMQGEKSVYWAPQVTHVSPGHIVTPWKTMTKITDAFQDCEGIKNTPPCWSPGGGIARGTQGTAETHMQWLLPPGPCRAHSWGGFLPVLLWILAALPLPAVLALGPRQDEQQPWMQPDDDLQTSTRLSSFLSFSSRGLSP